MANSGGRPALLLVRRFQWGHRQYSTGEAATKVSRFAALDARIEKALPAKLKTLWNHPAGSCLDLENIG